MPMKLSALPTARRVAAVLVLGTFFLHGRPAEALEADAAARLRRLEAETEALRAEVEWLRAHPVRLPSVEAASEAVVDSRLRGNDESQRELLAPEAAPAEPAYTLDEPAYTLDELKTEMKKLAWTKGDFRIVPYGVLWADMVYATSRTNPGSYTLYVFSADEHGENAFAIDARRTRLGLNVEGPPVPLFYNAASGGRVEIDFQGSFATTENRAGVLLRHAYWEAKGDYGRVLVGQTSDVMSPLYPGTYNYSVGWYAGNIGYRRAQFRVERYMHLSDTFLLTSQFAAAQNVVPDLATVPGVTRESAGWPILQGRVAGTIGPRGTGCRPLEIGVSGHIGETGFDFNVPGPSAHNPFNLPPVHDLRVRTWSLNVDFRKAITERLGVQGELFTGENLSPFFGGIGQGICPARRSAIRSTGGWFDVWFDLTPRWQTRAGWGLDDPNNHDLLVGRTYNQYYYWNLGCAITKNLFSGIEITSWKTLYQDNRPAPFDTGPTRPGESVTFDWMVKYEF
jgi:hypothetical protein